MIITEGFWADGVVGGGGGGGGAGGLKVVSQIMEFDSFLWHFPPPSPNPSPVVMLADKETKGGRKEGLV